MDLGGPLGRGGLVLSLPCLWVPGATSSLCAFSLRLPAGSFHTSCFTFSRPMSSAIWKLSTRTAITRLERGTVGYSRGGGCRTGSTLLWVRGLGRGSPRGGMGEESEAGERNRGGTLT